MAQKLCGVCGDDVAAKKRVKDTRGQYYCETCYANKRNAMMQAKQPAAPVAVASALEALPEMPELPPMDSIPEAIAPSAADDGMLDLAPEVKPAQQDVPKLGCATCKRLVPERQVRNLDGEFICNSCFAKRNAAARGTAGGKTKSAAKSTKSSGEEASQDGFANSILGGFVLAFTTLLVVFGIITAINIALPLPTMMADSSTAMGVGAVYDLYNAGICLILWTGVLIAVKVTGGNRPTFGAMLWKSFALGGVITIFSRVKDQMSFGEGLGIIGTVILIVRYYVMRIGVGTLFGLEMLPSRLISLAAVVLGWLVGFLFYVVLGVLVVAGTVHLKNDDGDRLDIGKEFQKGFQQELDRQKLEHTRAARPDAGAPAVEPGTENSPAGNAPAGESQPAPETSPAPL